MKEWDLKMLTASNHQFDYKLYKLLSWLYLILVRFIWKQIIWERGDLVYPLAVGANIFSPDSRLSLHFPQPNVSQLILSNATKEDAKIYRCRSTVPRNPVCVNGSCTEHGEAFERTFSAIYGKITNL